MPIQIQRYTEREVPAVQEFNRRLAAGGTSAEFHFPESPIPHWLPLKNSRRIYQDYYLALDEGIVRGAFILKYQEFVLGGTMQKLAYYHLPVSEGIVNRKFASVGAHMLRAAMRMEPAVYALGMGGFDRPLPTMLKAMRWQMAAVPFFFKVMHPTRFLRQIAPLRISSLRRAASQTAAVTGTGWLAVKGVQWMRSSKTAPSRVEVVDRFDSWSDELWQKCSRDYWMIGSRDSTTLNLLYPASKNFLCLKITSPRRTTGWAVLLDTQMSNNKYFGSLRVGSIVDCLATSEDAAGVVAAATRFLSRRGVDLVISNHSHEVWRRGFRSEGFFQGPSNFIFAASPVLAEKLVPFEKYQSQVYLNRGDGDGPVNL
jgi:hypothetical protein